MCYCSNKRSGSMFENSMLIFIAIIPITILLKYVFEKDKIEKEPFPLLIKLFLAGIFSAALVLFLTKSLNLILPIHNGVYISFIEVGFLEEISKWICVYLITWKNKEVDYKFDAIVYCIFVSLGFALIENIGYSITYGITTCLLRAIISVPGHAFFAIYMGYYLGIAKMAYTNYENSTGSTYTMYSILVPTFLHGIYNYCLLGENDGFYIFFIIFVISLYILSFKTVNTSSNTDMAFDTK